MPITYAPPGGDQFEFVESFASIGGSPAAITQNTLYLARIRVAKAITVTQMTYLVGTASGNVDLGIFTYSTSGSSYALVTSTGSTAASGANALQTINLLTGVVLAPGVDYALGFQADNATITAARASTNASMGFKNRGTTKALGGFGLATNAATVSSPSVATTAIWLAAA